MQELIAKANQVILEAQMLRREQRSLRFEASVLASQLGQTIVQSHLSRKNLPALEKESASLNSSPDQAFAKP